MASKEIQLGNITAPSIVSIEACENYQQAVVDQAVRRLLQQFGGLERWVRPGHRVHIKPNLLAAKAPDRAVTTHPSIVKAIVQWVQAIGARVTIGDSPAGISRPIADYWQATGMQQIAEETGAELVQFEKKGVVERVIDGKSYFIAAAVATADVVINICKLKTHNLMLYTGAIKNMFGTVPGFRKSEYHKQAPRVEDFAKIIVDVFAATRPQLSIMDAVEIMDGSGPSAGRPNHLGLLIASEDAVALDALGAQLLGFEDGEILTTEEAYARGFGEKQFDKIEFRGTALTPYQHLPFDLPSNRFQRHIPASLVRLLGKMVWVRPYPDAHRCKRCGICIANCPTRAMTPKDGFPMIDYDKCISCFCCDEVCPHHAIDQRMSWLAKMFR
ncbi:MAG: DUF362 domain-containing protein [candidate division KSB1 bacterium]|nr:DUF362 domain-containing protein [candidate division KSB1 bacterium]MDZ7318736.1 DUF362 domain-containing protein [candidate division KSB1 bacterium]MDZ7340527.1 DUF362 domain-containing protein [candidate division KSB1 bacterium]